MIRFLFSLLMIAVLAGSGYVYVVTRNLPDVDAVLRDGINPTQWTQVLARDGTPILSYGKFHHDDVTLDQVSSHFIDALLATEDRRFYQHRGIDPLAIGRALIRDVRHMQIREGGSTLTQQLARNVFLSSERSFSRKIREAALALELERKLNKDQILELYINNIYFGEGAYGIKAASEVYFNKPPSRLTVDEAAMLAGLPQAPSGYSPFHNPEGARKRRDEVLGNLKEVGKLDEQQLAMYTGKGFRLNTQGQELATADKAPFFNRYVMEQVQRYFALDEQTFWQSGLKIYTTLDLRAQRVATQAVRGRSTAWGWSGKNQQAALVSINPQTGAILAYVGGKDYRSSQFDRVAQATRSPGSLFKVFTYATAIDRGYEPSRVYLDEPIRMGDWVPQNYDKGHHGYMTLARALVTSNNVVAVKVINELGPESVIHTAQRMGIRSRLEPYLGLTLGGSGVNLLEITSAFGVLANQGVRVEPYAIEKITDSSGRIVYQQHPVKMDVLNRTTVDTMVKMMMGVINRGTGTAANISRPAAGKTGTSDDYRDAWFVGFTPDVVTGVWVGNDNNRPMPGMTGGSLPAVIWKSYMGAYLASRPIRDFDLAFSKALNESDYTTYDIENLSEEDMTNPLAVLEPKEPGELDTADPALDPDGQAVGPDGQPLDPALNPDMSREPFPTGPEATQRENPVLTPPMNPQPQGRPGAVPIGPPAPVPANPPAAGGGRPPGYPVIPLDRPQQQRSQSGPILDTAGRN